MTGPTNGMLFSHPNRQQFPSKCSQHVQTRFAARFAQPRSQQQNLAQFVSREPSALRQYDGPHSTRFPLNASNKDGINWPMGRHTRSRRQQSSRERRDSAAAIVKSCDAKCRRLGSGVCADHESSDNCAKVCRYTCTIIPGT